MALAVTLDRSVCPSENAGKAQKDKVLHLLAPLWNKPKKVCIAKGWAKCHNTVLLMSPAQACLAGLVLPLVANREPPPVSSIHSRPSAFSQRVHKASSPFSG